LGLYLETRKGPANVNHIAATMLLAAGAAGLIFVLHPGWAAAFAGLGLSFVSATTVYRTHRQAVIGAAVACATIIATLYVGTVAWTLRYDRQNEAAIKAYLTEADRLRPISSR